MVLKKFMIRGGRTERIAAASLLVLILTSITWAYQTSKRELEGAYRRHTVDLSHSLESLTSKLTLISNIGILQDHLRARNKIRTQKLLNRAIFNEDSVSNLFLIDRYNKIIAQNNYNAGGMYVGENSELKRTNWEYVAAQNTVVNKFGEFGYFQNKKMRLAYISKVVSAGDQRLGQIVAVLRYGEVIDGLNIKYGFPPGTRVQLVDNPKELDASFKCNSIHESAEGYSLCYPSDFGTVLWKAKWRIIAAFFTSLIVAAMLFSIVYLINQKLVIPVDYFNALMRLLDGKDLRNVEDIPVPEGLENLQPKVKALVEAVHRASSVDLARQVAHDIRSPLAALNIVLDSVGQLDEENRLLARHSITRIQDIANNLLIMSRSQDLQAQTEAQELDGYLISGLLDSLVSEKRTQYRERIDVEIDYKQRPESYGIFCEVLPSEFKRVLSNLINNSVEAISGKGTVTISLESANGMAVISIRDTGRGLPPELLKRIGSETFTAKKTGFGLGLTHAFKTIEGWGGTLHFESSVDLGTLVSIRLPLVRSPDWFVDELSLKANTKVVVLDDDLSIHQIWDQRLAEFASHLDVVHLSTPEQFYEYFKSHSKDNSICLIDFELLGFEQSGLDIVKDLNLCDRSFLVTSHFEEENVRSACREAGVKLIPKGLAGFIPVKVERIVDLIKVDAVLIEDEPLICDVWRMHAKDFGKDLACFPSYEAFKEHAVSLSRSIPIYVDSDGMGGRAQEILQRLRTEGFMNLRMATGDSVADLSN